MKLREKELPNNILRFRREEREGWGEREGKVDQAG